MIILIRKMLIFMFVFFPILAILVMLVDWQVDKQKPMAVLVLNKTLIPKEELQKQPFFWVLKHNHFVRPNGITYNFENDFLGFKPKSNEKSYAMVSMDKITDDKVHYFADNMQASYYVGTNAWCYDGHYGEMSNKEFNFIKKMKDDGKLVINEFNIIQSPWNKQLRINFENEFGIKSTGWIGGYFASLDSLITDLPVWLIRKYQKQNQGKWPFTHEGVVFLHESGSLVILEGSKDLYIGRPLIRTLGFGNRYYHMPRTMEFSKWFQIVEMTDTLNHALSVFELKVSEKGRQQLMEKNIPTIFPAVILQKTNHHEFYYFCANFSSNRIPTNSLYLTGGQHIALMIDGRQENLFFYKFYRPLVTSILNNYFYKKNQFNQVPTK